MSLNLKSKRSGVALLTFLLALATTLSLATNAMAKPEAKKKETAAPAATYKVSPESSTVNWTGKKVLVDSAHRGTIAVKTGEVEIKDNMISKGQFDLDMNSISNVDLAASPTDKGKLEGHLKSPDFFDVQKFPTASFKITSTKALPTPKPGEATHEITGDLTIKGKTNSVSFPAVVSVADGKAEATANLKIDRTKWDVRYGSDKFFKGLGDKVIANDIDFNLKIVAKK